MVRKPENKKTGKNDTPLNRPKARAEMLERVNGELRDQIDKLEHEKQQMTQGKSMVSQAEYQGLLKQLEREIQLKEHYMRLYEKEREKRNELKKSFKTEIENKNVNPASEETQKLIRRIEELEAKLSRKGTGRPRNNKATDDNVLKLRNESKTIREICSITGMSTATVVKVLKRFNAGNS